MFIFHVTGEQQKDKISFIVDPQPPTQTGIGGIEGQYVLNPPSANQPQATTQQVFELILIAFILWTRI